MWACRANEEKPPFVSGFCSQQVREIGGGAEGQTRTVDTGIFSAVLYHLSYLGRKTYLKAATADCQGNGIGDSVPFQVG